MHSDEQKLNPSSGDATFAADQEPAAAAGGARPKDDDPGDFKVFDRRSSAAAKAADLDEADRPRVPSYVEQLQQQVAEKDRQLREYIAAYKKEVVENLEQTKQRLARDAEQRAKALRGELAEPMIEVLDALERSLGAGAASGEAQALVEGVKMVHTLMLQKLALLGLERIETVGAPFDPKVHEAVATASIDDPDQHNKVLQELSAGFVLDGRVVRPARVQVGRLRS